MTCAKERLAMVKHLIRELNRRYGYYESPRSGRILTEALRQEFNDMESLLAKAYTAIEEQEKAVDQQMTTLTQQVSELTDKVASLSTAPEPPPAAPETPHDGGLIFTAKGRAVGSSEDRVVLDTIIDRVTPEAPADPAFVPPAPPAKA